MIQKSRNVVKSRNVKWWNQEMLLNGGIKKWYKHRKML